MWLTDCASVLNNHDLHAMDEKMFNDKKMKMNSMYDKGLFNS